MICLLHPMPLLALLLFCCVPISSLLTAVSPSPRLISLYFQLLLLQESFTGSVPTSGWALSMLIKDSPDEL